MSLLRKVFHYLQRKILTVLGDIKVFRWPMFMVYDPNNYRLNGKQFKELKGELKRYDVLLVRYDKYLDGYLIPGWWNHAGIYLGDGMVEHAISEGVVVTTLFDFCKVDHVIALRPTFHFDPVEVDKFLEKYIGCEYDFAFDCSDNSTIYCSELIFQAFQGFEHGITKTLYVGKEVVLPDSLISANFKEVYRAINETRV